MEYEDIRDAEDAVKGKVTCSGLFNAKHVTPVGHGNSARMFKP